MKRQQEYNILLVDNAVLNSRIIHSTLSELDECCIVHTCSTGDEAFLFINECDFYKLPQLIYFSIDITKADGLQFVKEIKGHKEYRKIPLVILTHVDDTEKIKTAYDHFANCILHVATEEEKFRQTIKESWQFWLRTAKLPQRASML